MKAGLLALVLLVLPMGATAAEPVETLDKYFLILTERNYENIGALMDSKSMASLKLLLDRAITTQAERGSTDLMVRIFGERVSAEQVASTPPEVYLERLAREVLKAADVQRFYVDNRRLLGRVDESEVMTHYVVRLYMHQSDRSNSDVMVYTLVKEGDEWKLQFPPTIKQMLALIEAGTAR